MGCSRSREISPRFVRRTLRRGDGNRSPVDPWRSVIGDGEMNLTMRTKTAAFLGVVALALAGCARQQAEKKVTEPTMQERLAKYAQIRLETDPSGLTDKERQMIPLLIDAAKVMDDLFWLQTYGDK